MSKESRQAERLDAIRSVSLEDIVKGRHTRWRRFLKKAKPAIVAVSLLGLTAAAGSAVYTVLGGPDDRFPAEIARTDPQPALLSTGSLPAHETTTAAIETAEPAAPETGEPMVARLPTPRPDEPVVTGSIHRPVRMVPAYAPQRVETRRHQFCITMQQLTAQLPFARVYCVR